MVRGVSKFGILLVLAVLLVMALPAAAQDECGVLESGTITAGVPQNFGPYNFTAGTYIYVFVKDTNTGGGTTYTIAVTLNGLPMPPVAGTLNGTSNKAEVTLPIDAIVAGTVTLTAGSVKYRVGLSPCIYDEPETETDTPTTSPEPEIDPDQVADLGGIGKLYVDETGIYLYAIDADGNTYLALYLVATEVNDGPPPAENTLIVGTTDGYFSLYRLTTGEYQINVGPDADGKVKVIIFDGIPPSDVYGYEFFVTP